MDEMAMMFHVLSMNQKNVWTCLSLEISTIENLKLKDLKVHNLDEKMNEHDLQFSLRVVPGKIVHRLPPKGLVCNLLLRRQPLTKLPRLFEIEVGIPSGMVHFLQIGHPVSAMYCQHPASSQQDRVYL